MTNVVAQQQQPRTGSRVGNLGVAAAATLAAVAVWTLWTQAAGVELRTETGEVGPVAVVVTSLAAAGLGVALARLLVRRAGGLRVWSVVACVVWAVSFLGPLSATTSMAVLGLASLHLVVGTVVIIGVRRVHSRVRPSSYEERVA